MDRDALYFTRIDVQRMYAAPQKGLRLDELTPGINVVYGPNASGKTTVARSLDVLLWPEVSEDGHAAVRGRFLLGGAEWLAEIDGSRALYQKDGADTGRPAVPSSDKRDRYHLYLHELLRLIDGPDSFAQAIQRDAVGGYDVDAARKRLELSEKPKHKAGSTHAVEEALERVQAVEQEQLSLQGEQQRLGGLEEELRRAKEAQRNVTVLEHVVHLLSARNAERNARKRLEQFPGIMGSMAGNEAERLEELRSNREEAGQTLDDAAGEIESAKETLKECPLPEGGLPEGFLSGLREGIRTLKKNEETAVSIEKDLVGARKRADDCWSAVAALGDREKAQGLRIEHLPRLVQFARKAERHRARRAAVEEKARLFEPGEPEEKTTAVEDMRDGIRYLHRWLAEPEQARFAETDTGRLVRKLLLVGGIGLLVAGAVLAVLVHPLGWLAALAGLAMLALVLFLKDDRQDTPGRARFAKDYERLDLETPAEWEWDAVEDLSDRLARRLASLYLQDEKSRRYEQLRAEREQLEEVEEHLAIERQAILDEIGTSTDQAEEELVYLVHGVREWQKETVLVSGLEEELEEVHRSIRRARGRVNEMLKAHGFEPVRDSIDAEARWAAIDEAKRIFDREKQTLHLGRRRHARAEREIAGLDRKIAALYDRLDLQVGDVDAVQQLCGDFPDFQDVQQAQRDASGRLDAEHERLEELGADASDWGDRSTSDVERELEAAQEVAGRAAAVAEEIGGLKQQVRGAMEAHDLEEARAIYQDKLKVLRRDREQNLASAVGALVADFVEEATRDQGLPTVFRRARELFGVITRGRYRLDLDRQSTCFRGYDTEKERGFALGELSSGTRIQLLLAVRLAFIEQLETSCKLPLVLDETLANSDDERASAIIQAIRTISDEGRQVFYFTAQIDEVRKWMSESDSDDSADCRFIALDGAVPPAEIEPRPEIPAPATSLPDLDPETATHEELFEALGVPPWSLRETAGSIHLWYLVDNPVCLYRLIEAGLVRWGPLKELAERGGLASVGLDEREFGEIRARARVLQAWKAAWLIGRGKPVGRLALEESGAVSDTFIDRVADLCAEVGQEGAAIIDSLDARKVKGFLSSKTRDLQEYFEREGYIHPEDTLSGEQIWSRVLGELAAEVETGLIDVEAVRIVMDRAERGAG